MYTHEKIRSVSELGHVISMFSCSRCVVRSFPSCENTVIHTGIGQK